MIEIANEEHKGIKYKNWLIIGTELVKRQFNRKVELKVICDCGSEQVRSFLHVLNTLGHCNKCGEEPLTFTYSYRVLSPAIGIKFDTLKIVDKITENNIEKWLLKCELCYHEMKIHKIINPRPCSACTGLMGTRIHELVMTAIITNPTGKAYNQKIMAKCDCGSINPYKLSTFRSGSIKRCKACNKKLHQSGILNYNRQRKLRLIELEEQLKIMSEKLKEYEQKNLTL